MSSFINNLIDRSVAPATNIQPRLRGKFEQVAAASESFADNEEVTSAGASQSTDETIIQPRRTELVRRTHVTKFIEERSEQISPSLPKKVFQKDTEQSVPDMKAERPQRFQPSYNVVVQTPQQDPSETNITNIYQQPKVIERVIDPGNENKQSQAPAPQPDASSSTIITKGVYKPQPVVKPIANNTFRIEPQQKVQPKQSRAASLIQRQTVQPAASRTINISIGRIEVRVSQPTAANAAKPKKEGIPIMGLDEYLQQRNQRGQ
jgi:hypothetical protein